MSKPQNSSKKDKPAKGGSPFLRFFVKAGIFCAGLFLCGVLLAGMALALAWPNLPDLNAMTDYRPRVPLRVYTADRVLIGEFGEERRNVLRFNEIPDVMKSAVLAAEDDRFYQHGGIDWVGVVRAGLTNLVNMSKTQGASTITMQVARNFYLSSEKTYSRKFYELLLTFKIESQLTKDQILELYMNQIYLGHRAYGFAAASRTYFGKQLSDITPAEAAMLAGIPKAPSRFNPIANRPRAELRQRYVLGRMQSLGYLTEAEYKQAMAQPIVMKSAEGTPAGGYAIHGEYVAELARQLLFNVYQDNVYSRGLNIYTTVQSKDQEAAYRAVREGVLEYTRRAPYPGPEEQLDLPAGTESNPQALDDFLDGVFDKFSDSGDLLTALVLSASPTEVKLARSSREIITITDKKVLGVVARALNDKAKPEQRIKRGSVVYIRKFGDNWEIINLPAVQAAFVALSPQDGAIRAMVGGFDFYRGNFNRVTQAWRQPGSNIKPFIYAASLERGLTPATQISDLPFELSAAQTGSKAWTPKNYGNQYEPMLTLRQGLYKSKNMVSIRILQAIGPQYGQDYLTRFGFDKARQPAVLPLALGAGSVTPLQVAGAYAVFANGGYRITPYLIDRVTDSNGKVIMQSAGRGRRRGGPRHRSAHRLDHGRHPARRGHLRHRRPRARAAQAQRHRRQDRHHQRIGGRLVLGLHALAGGDLVAGLRPAQVAGLARDRRRRRHADLGGLHADRAQGRAEEKPRPARTASSSRTANTISRNSRRDRRWPAWACRKPTRWASSSTAWAAAARTTASRWRRASAPGQRPWSQKIPF